MDSREGAETVLKVCILEAQVEDALQGCELEHSQAAETITGNYEAKCNLWPMTTWVDVTGIQPVQDVTLIPRSHWHQREVVKGFDTLPGISRRLI